MVTYSGRLPVVLGAHTGVRAAASSGGFTLWSVGSVDVRGQGIPAGKPGVRGMWVKGGRSGSCAAA